jgi:hypothetical protein
VYFSKRREGNKCDSLFLWSSVVTDPIVSS